MIHSFRSSDTYFVHFRCAVYHFGFRLQNCYCLISNMTAHVLWLSEYHVYREYVKLLTMFCFTCYVFRMRNTKILKYSIGPLCYSVKTKFPIDFISLTQRKLKLLVPLLILIGWAVCCTILQKTNTTNLLFTLSPLSARSTMRQSPHHTCIQLFFATWLSPVPTALPSASCLTRLAFSAFLSTTAIFLPASCHPPILHSLTPLTRI